MIGIALPSRPIVDLTSASVVAEPFRYALASDCLRPNAGEALLRWLEGDAPWELTVADFYEQFEFSLWDSDAPVAAMFTDAALLDELRAEMSRLFGKRFSKRVTVVAHRLDPGQRIAIHNDYLCGEETHRLVVQANRGLADSDGGLLMLFNSADARDVHRVLRSTHLSGLAFEISARSFHAVSRMHANLRYTLVFSFFAEAS